MGRKKADDQQIRERREQILEAAQNVFAERGFHQANIAHIASELGMGHGTFYRYFKNKRDIFVCLIQDIFTKVATALSEESPDASNNLKEYREQVWRIGDKLMSLFLEDESLGRILQYESWGLDEELRGQVREAMDSFGGLTELYLKNGVKKGFLKMDLDTQLAALSINAVIFEGAKRLSSANRRPEKLKQRWLKTVTNMMFEGIGK